MNTMVILFGVTIKPTEEVEYVYLGPDPQLAEMDVQLSLPAESGPMFRFRISTVTVDALTN